MVSNYYEKAIALEALAEISISIDCNGQWFVTQGVEIKDGYILRSACGRGITPEVAIENHWDELTELPKDQYIVKNGGNEKRIAVRWNGFMWQPVKEKRED
jgi:hypothetical protein